MPAVISAGRLSYLPHLSIGHYHPHSSPIPHCSHNRRSPTAPSWSLRSDALPSSTSLPPRSNRPHKPATRWACPASTCSGACLPSRRLRAVPPGGVTLRASAIRRASLAILVDLPALDSSCRAQRYSSEHDKHERNRAGIPQQCAHVARRPRARRAGASPKLRALALSRGGC
jgi:hypothetical protein